MRPIVIYLVGFMHGQTPLLKLHFQTSDFIQSQLKALEYVYYSYQYKCFYVRRKEDVIRLLQQDLKGVIISRKQLETVEPGKGTADSTKVMLQEDEKPQVQVVIVNDKVYLRLPKFYRKTWVGFLQDMGAVFEARRRFWLIPGFANKQKRIESYFKGEKCEVRIRFKPDERVLVHSRKNNYRSDKEIQSFIKVMTLQGASRRTIDNYASQVKKIKDYYEGRLMAEISDEEIRDYLFFLREELSYSASAQNIVVSAVKRFLLSLTEREVNAFHIPRPGKRRSLPKVLDKTEVKALLQQQMYLKHKCLLFILYATGIRCGELVKLRVEDIDFDRQVIVVKKGKGGKDRLVGLPLKLKVMLEQYMKTERPVGYLFEGQFGGAYSTSSVRKMLRKAVEKAGIDKRVTPHMLRHSFATHLHDSGMDIRHIQKLLGHRSTKTTEIYTYVSKKDITQLKSPIDDLDI